MGLIRVFVYGTLKPGECNFDLYCAGRVVQMQPAIAYGTLFDLPFGYPAMTGGDRPVYGYLLGFSDPAILIALDELEDFDPCRPADCNEYVRVKQAVFDLEGRSLGEAWVYLMQPELVERAGGVLLLQGKWTAIRELT
ncbi:gamma-glutamylcyclotransferase [Phormidium tenue FACHB-886]|nr:gamma-glutamylcyclotransferase [Phormidium tenue FACHB-886]